jgi:hypothetical protein
MTNTFTDAIGIFEREAWLIRAAYDAEVRRGVPVSVDRVIQRDDAIGQCQWAIELLHKAWVKDNPPRPL